VKAAVLYETKEPFRIVELERASPKSGEVQVDVDVAGVCLSDHHFMEGTAAMALPAVLGHEGAGTVASVGQDVDGLKAGDRCIFSFASNCGHCRTCREGTPHMCLTNRRTGGHQFDGTLRLRDGEGDEIYQMSKLGLFGQEAVIPAQACHPIPDDVPMDVAALIGCCVATGVGAVINQPGLKAGATVAVFGCGGVGINVIQGARLMNAARIIAVDLADDKLEFAQRFGATDVVNASNTDPVEAIKELTGGGVEWAFDAYGSAQTISQCVDILRPSGTAVMVGLAPDGERAPIEMTTLVRNQKTLTGSYYGSGSPHETFERMIDFYLRERIDVAGLIQRRYTLEQINEGFDDLLGGKLGRGVIEMR
jgi:S-(hydroxymethyl)glutathione dehydrogenase / alcohol dehydrogenase